MIAPAEDGHWLQVVNMGDGIGNGGKHRIRALVTVWEYCSAALSYVSNGSYIDLSEVNLDVPEHEPTG